MTTRLFGFLFGIAAFVLILSLSPPDSFGTTATRLLAGVGGQIDPEALAGSMQRTLAVMALMVVWWVTEAVPLPATALVPVVALPLLGVLGVQGGVVARSTLGSVAANYAHPVIFLFLGGFLMAAAIRSWNLDRRLTLWILSRGRLAEDPRLIMLAMMGMTAFISMWISNAATTALMIPLALGILSLLRAEPGRSKYGTGLLLGIAWAASIGGTGTMIGTPPNGITVGILNSTLGHDPGYRPLTFIGWMQFGVPFVLLYVPLAWLLILKLFPPEVGRVEGGTRQMLGAFKALGPLTRGEGLTLIALGLAAALWIVLPLVRVLVPGISLGPLAGVDEYMVGILVGVLMFVIPVDLRGGRFLLDWEATRSVEWGVLILFGGGLALSDAMFRSGLALWIASTFIAVFGSPPTVILVLAVMLLVVALTEIASNTAVATMMVPVAITIGKETGVSPAMLAVATGVASSLAFMLPVSTPPNAMVFSTGYISIRQMIRGGVLLDLIGWLLAAAVVYFLAGELLGIFPV